MLINPDHGCAALTAGIVKRRDIGELLFSWEDLCHRCVEDNVYYSVHYALALLESVDSGRDVSFAVVRDRQRLLGLLPFVTSRGLWPGFGAAGVAWQTPYTFGCLPLLDAAETARAAAALVEALANTGLRNWMIPKINTGGEAGRALIAALEKRSLPWRTTEVFQRAAIQRGLDFHSHMKAHVDAKRRRELARNRRRLSEQGKLEHVVSTGGAALDKSVRDFLAIEAKGWKGRRGTGLACDQDSLRFAMDAFTAARGSSICRADVLLLDGRPIAAGLIAQMGRTGFTVKCAYDEDFRSFGAGLLLEEDVIRSFLSETWADRLDAATGGTHVIDRLWPERTEVGDLIFTLDQAMSPRRFSWLMAIDRSRRRAREQLKILRNRVRRHP